MLTVTLNQLRASNAFGNLHGTYSHLRRLLGKIEGSRSLLHPLGRAYGPDTPITIPQIAEAYSVEVALQALRADGCCEPRQRDRITMRYVIEASTHTLYAFEQVFPDDSRPRDAISSAVACFEFYSSPDVWMAPNNRDYGHFVVPLAVHVAQAALDASDYAAQAALDASGSVKTTNARSAAKCAAWAAGQAAGMGYNYAFPIHGDRLRQRALLKPTFSASERADFLSNAHHAADEAVWNSQLAALILGRSAEVFEWERSKFLEILAAEE